MGFLLFYRALAMARWTRCGSQSQPDQIRTKNVDKRRFAPDWYVRCEVWLRLTGSTYRPRFPRLGRDPEVLPRDCEALRPGCALVPRLPWLCPCERPPVPLRRPRKLGRPVSDGALDCPADSPRHE